MSSRGARSIDALLGASERSKFVRWSRPGARDEARRVRSQLSDCRLSSGRQAARVLCRRTRLQAARSRQPVAAVARWMLVLLLCLSWGGRRWKAGDGRVGRGGTDTEVRKYPRTRWAAKAVKAVKTEAGQRRDQLHPPFFFHRFLRPSAVAVWLVFCVRS